MTAEPTADRPLRVLVVGGTGPLTRNLAEAAASASSTGVCSVETGSDLGAALQADLDLLLYVGGDRGRRPGEPRASDLERVLTAGPADPGRLLLVSSTMVHEPHHTHPGLVEEERLARRGPRNRITAGWRELESVARRWAESSGASLTVLRPAPVPIAGSRDFWSRLFAGRVAATVAGYDPVVQLLALEDLRTAVERAVEKGESGVFHLAPRGVAPLARALALADVRSLPLPRWGHLVAGRAQRRRAAAGSGERLDYLRYSFTVSGRRAARILDFVPRRSSAEAAAALAPPPLSAGAPVPEFDSYGLSPAFVAARDRRLQGFLDRVWWRHETRGLERIPRQGRAMLVGLHRGFMPWDGVITVQRVRRGSGRYARFLIHPTLVKFPFLYNTMTRMGGVVACVENADRILSEEGLLAVYPEGIQGAFSYYRDAYRLKRFGRDRFAKMALRNNAPIVPFVTLGSAEIYPILAKLGWRWWKRFSEWPCLPITPTFPLLPVPLPSKWHTLFLEPMRIDEEFPPEAAEDPDVVAEVGRRVRRVLADTLADLRARRRSIFRGSILGPEDG